MRRINKELEKERELLNRFAVRELAGEEKGVLSDSVLEQSRKVDSLVSVVEREELTKRSLWGKMYDS
jgi:hypothetical protein